jgi:predicted AAA+ superfamily ATPase
LQLLELLYEKEFKNIPAIPRKLSIVEDDKIILCGTRGAGKSWLIYDYLQFEAFGSYLYIDFQDFRVSGITKEKLEKFINEKKITTLVLENFDFSFSPPTTLKTIITTTKKVFLDGYVTKVLYPLDFEEFISFDKKFISEQNTFNYFTIRGTYPFVVTSSKNSFEKNFQMMLKSFYHDRLEFELLKKLSLKQGSLITLLGLFKEIKEKEKISKDKFYALMEKLQDEMVIFLIPKYGVNSHKKKIYMIDFAIRGVISHGKDFVKRYENIIFLELLKRGEEIYYSDRVEFILPKKSLAILPVLFLPEGLLKNRLKLLIPSLKKMGIKKLQAITLDPEFSFKEDGVECEALTFWSFALGN